MIAKTHRCETTKANYLVLTSRTGIKHLVISFEDSGEIKIRSPNHNVAETLRELASSLGVGVTSCREYTQLTIEDDNDKQKNTENA